MVWVGWPASIKERFEAVSPIARGKYKPKPGEPTQSLIRLNAILAEVPSDENRALLRVKMSRRGQRKARAFRCRPKVQRMS